MDFQQNHRPMKIFVGGFTVDTTEQTLFEHFCPYGPIHDVIIIRNKATNVSKGYGFISTVDPETYSAIIHSHQELGGRKLDCFPGFKKAENPDLFDRFCNLKIFVGGISLETTDEDLLTYFQAYGRVRKAFIIRNPHTNKSRKFGFVIMEDEHEADRVLLQKRHRIRNVMVTIKRFSKEEDYRQMQLEKKLMQAAAADQKTPQVGALIFGSTGTHLNNHPHKLNAPRLPCYSRPQPRDRLQFYPATAGPLLPISASTSNPDEDRSTHSGDKRQPLAAVPLLQQTADANLQFNLCRDKAFYQKLQARVAFFGL